MSFIKHKLKFSLNYKNILQYQSVKKLHSCSIRNPVNKRYEEIKIPVPWGHIAGKWWGPQNIRPILALHGLQDSCNTFDPLLNVLPENVAFLAFDFPGNGHSSHLPNGIFYHNLDYSLFVRRIQKHFNWPKISLMGHSKGAVISFLFAGLYPDDVDMLILIDGVKPMTRSSADEIQKTADNFDQFLHYDMKKDTKQLRYFTYDELIQKIHSSTKKSVTLEDCKIILDRIIVQSDKDPNKFSFSYDIKTKIEPLVHMQHHDIIEYAKRIQCPTLVIKTTDTYFENKEYFYDVINILQRKIDFRYTRIEGTHHVHINAPEIVETLIREFLQKYNHLDRTIGELKQEIKCDSN